MHEAGQKMNKNSGLRSQADGWLLMVEHREQIPEENATIDLQLEALIRLQTTEAHYSQVSLIPNEQ